jgi:hypothetical protein
MTLRDAAGFAACRRMSPATKIPAGALIVERTGREGASFTVLAGPNVLFGCDMAPGPKGGSPRPCAVAVGKVSAGRLLDPRLTLRCGFGRPRPLAFAWIRPLRRTRWIVIRTASADEVYKTARRLPVRVATTVDVAAEDASATFEIEELAADGHVLTQETERIVVAG